MLVGYAPGGSADAGIRPLSRVLEPLPGQPLIIEYRPGNAGGVAMEFIAKAGTDKAGMDAINATGCDAEILPPAQTVDKIKTDFVKWGRVVKDANIRTD